MVFIVVQFFIFKDSHQNNFNTYHGKGLNYIGAFILIPLIKYKRTHENLKKMTV